ncbi:MAG TPA: LytTR family DNA-binding domain-containing protein [Gemmatimonadaceae bacterium]
MSALRVFLVDDERPARARMRRLLGEMADVEVVGEAGSGREAVTAIASLRPDLVLLDVQMPGLDGFGVLAALDQATLPRIVFVTAHDAFAVRAFEVSALDYLLKPVAPERLRAAVERARRSIASEAPATLEERVRRMEHLLRTLDRSPEEAGEGEPASAPVPAAAAHRPLERLLVTVGERSFFVPVRQVLWMESSRNYVELHVGREAYTIRATLSALEERLDPATWVRINRSQLVNLDAIAHLEPWFHGEHRVVLRDGTKLTWSRRYLDRADEVLGRKL